MSKMPTDRTSEWGRLFDRFGTPDGALRKRPVTEPAKPLSDPTSGGLLGRLVGNERQSVPKRSRGTKR